MLELLKAHFPRIKELFPYQKQAIDSILNGENTLSIVPTSGGKSLIFQLASLKLPGTTIVVSPLNALMMEQVDELTSNSINAMLINGEIPFVEQRERLRSLEEAKPKIIYVSPERLHNYFFRSAILFGKREVSLLVIDEAHCISQWGIDFRPDYGLIKPFIQFLKDNSQNPVILALTATLGIKAREDIVKEFSIKREFVNNNVIRDNLSLNFLRVDDDKQKWGEMLNFIQKQKLKKVLVYLYSQDKCEKFSSEIDTSGYFHADMASDEKRSIIERFRSGDIKILFATTAFGMGINIPDIDGIIHYQLPGSVEEYYQHVGRGARKPETCPKCHCLLLWSGTNFDRRRKRIKSETLVLEDLERGFSHLNLTNKAGKKALVNPNDFGYVNGKYGTIRLKLIYRMFEKYGICETIGEVHGTPKSIQFKNITDTWKLILDKIGINNQFIAAESKTGIPLQEIINHVYEQELKGNIIKLPAKEKKLYLKSSYNNLPEDIANKIIEESLEIEKFKLAELAELEELCKTSNPEQYIAKILGV